MRECTLAYEKNLVSVVIPTYNRQKTLEASIRSVTSQTYDDIEVLVVDDGSSDGSHELVQQMQRNDSRIRYMKNTMGKGVAGARNTGIRASRGEFIAFNDSDDYFRSDKICKQLSKIQTADFCYGRFKKIVDEKSYMIFPPYNTNDLNGDIYKRLLKNNMVGCPTLMVRHDFLDQIGGFDPEFPALEDYDLALRLAKRGTAVFIEDIILDSDNSAGGISSNVGNDMAANLMLLQKYLPDIIEAGLLNYKVMHTLSYANTLGVQDKVTGIIKHILEQYEMKASGSI